MSKWSTQRRSFHVPIDLIGTSWKLLEGPGRRELEASVLWLGRMADDNTVEIVSAVRPNQIARRGPLGVSVEITQQGLTELIMSLPAGVFVAARLHTHPGDAYHSEVDDANMVISHEGAVSIVVPSFATGPADLGSCSVNELRRGGWVHLDPAEVAARFQLT